MLLPKLNISKKVLRQHLIFWLVFIVYESAVNYSFSGHFALVADYITYNILNIIFFYICAYLLMRFILNRKLVYIRFVIFSLMEVFLYVGVKYSIKLLYIKLGIYHEVQHEKIADFIRNTLWRAIYFIGLSTTYGLARYAIDYRSKVAEFELKDLRDEIQKNKLVTELLAKEVSFRRAQINPHFVFNALGFVYNNVAEISEPAGDMVLLLSDVMRYALAEPELDGKVAIGSEISHIQNYIRLNQSRYEQNLKIDFLADNENPTARIIPLILITLVENVFKYGELRKAESPAQLNLSVNAERLLFTIRNNKATRPHTHSMGIGMTNVAERLNDNYRGQYQLTLENSPEEYKLTLFINLQ